MSLLHTIFYTFLITLDVRICSLIKKYPLLKFFLLKKMLKESQQESEEKIFTFQQHLESEVVELLVLNYSRMKCPATLRDALPVKTAKSY